MATKPEKLNQDYIQAWNTHDVEKVLSHFTDDIVYEDMVLAKVMRGKAELRTFATDTFTAFPDFKIDLKFFFVSGEWAGSEWVMSGTSKGEAFGQKPTGKSFSVRGASITELRGDKIRRNTDYYDGATFLRQIGMMPQTWPPLARRTSGCVFPLQPQMVTGGVCEVPHNSVYGFSRETPEGGEAGCGHGGEVRGCDNEISANAPASRQ